MIIYEWNRTFTKNIPGKFCSRHWAWKARNG